jgi:hypothetical protein
MMTIFSPVERVIFLLGCADSSLGCGWRGELEKAI